MIHDRRIKKIRIDIPTLLEMIMLSWGKSETPKVIYKHIFPNLPDDTRVVTIAHQLDPMRLTVYVSSKEFPEIAPGEYPPDVLDRSEYFIQAVPYMIPVVDEQNNVVGYRSCYSPEKTLDLLKPVPLAEHNESVEPTFVRVT